MENIEKPRFVYTGSKDQYSVKWHNTDTNAETNKSGSVHFIIVLKDKRIDCYFPNPIQVIDYAKKTIEVKSEGRGKKYASGTARIYVVDKATKKEVLATVVEKLTTRYYEPVSRFNHDKGESYEYY